MTDLSFLPYLRRGLARHVEAADPGTGGLGPATVSMSVTLAGHPCSDDVALLAPHRVQSIDAGRDPAPLPRARTRSTSSRTTSR